MFLETGGLKTSSNWRPTVLVTDNDGAVDVKPSNHHEHTIARHARGRRYTKYNLGYHSELISCNRCIPKMDHHCPWTANCVSHFTFPHFVRFLFYAVVGMSYLETLLFERASIVWASRNLPSVRRGSFRLSALR